MPTLSKIRKAQKNRQENHSLNVQAKNTIDKLSSFSDKTQKCDKLISTIELSLKFWKMRNQDKTSETIVNHYLTKAELFLDRRQEEKSE